MTQKQATLRLDQKELSLPVYSGTLGPDVIDINQLAKEGVFTFDPGFMSTASCESKITFRLQNIGASHSPCLSRSPLRP